MAAVLSSLRQQVEQPYLWLDSGTLAYTDELAALIAKHRESAESFVDLLPLPSSLLSITNAAERAERAALLSGATAEDGSRGFEELDQCVRQFEALVSSGSNERALHYGSSLLLRVLSRRAAVAERLRQDDRVVGWRALDDFARLDCVRFGGESVRALHLAFILKDLVRAEQQRDIASVLGGLWVRLDEVVGRYSPRALLSDATERWLQINLSELAWVVEWSSARLPAALTPAEEHWFSAAWYATATSDHLYPKLLEVAGKRNQIRARMIGKRWQYEFASVTSAYSQHRLTLESALNRLRREREPKVTKGNKSIGEP